MNAAFVLPYFAYQFGGPVAAVRGLGMELSRRDVDVSYWAPGSAEDRRELEGLNNCHVYDLDWPHRWRRSQGMVRGLVESVRSIDLMHINGFWLHPTYAAARIAHNNRVPYILRPAGTLAPWCLRNGRFKSWRKTVYLKLVARATMRDAACLQAASEQEAENFRRVGYSGPVTIIPNGVDTAEYTPGDPTEAEAHWPELRGRPVVVFMSRLSPEKGLDMLIPLWARLVQSGSHRDAVLVLAGPDDRGYQRTVQAIIDKHGIASHILMTGMVQGRRKLALLRRADVFILPSYSENFGIVVPEALACATPVITTTGTPWRLLEEVGAGRWVKPEPGELACAISELLNMSQSQRKAMGHRGRRLVEEQYTWDAIVAKFLTVCDCVRQGKAVPLHPEIMEPAPA